MKKRTIMLKLLYLGLVICLLSSIAVLAGCSSKVSTSATTTATQTQTTTATQTQTTTTKITTSAPSPTASPTAPAIKTGGILKVAIGTDAMILGDNQETRKTGMIMQKACIEALGRFDDKAMLQPFLAESWTEDPVNKTFTVKIKKDIKFHDGTDFKASAVKWSWDRFIKANSAYTTAVASVEVVDDYTVKAILKTWNNACPFQLCYWAGGIVSPTAWEKNGEAWGKLNPVGTGPFKFVSWVTDSLIKFEKFDGYWQKGKPYLAGVEFHIIADEATRSASFEAGQVDMIEMATVVQAHTLSKSKKYEIVQLKNGVGTGIQMLTFDAGKPDSQFTNLKVRQAIAYAIDKKSIVDNTYYGFATVADQFGTPTNWGYNPNLTVYPYDPAKAKALLAEAGNPKIQTTLTCLGEETQFTAISGMLAEVGITVKVNVVPPGQWYQLATTGWTGLLQMPSPPDGDISTRFGFMTSTSKMGVSQLRAAGNDELNTKMTSAPTFEEKKALTQEFQQRVFGEQVACIALYTQDDTAVKYSYVKNDGFCVRNGQEWTPEDAWLNK